VKVKVVVVAVADLPAEELNGFLAV